MMPLIIISGVIAGVGLTLLLSPLLPRQMSVKSAMTNLSADAKTLQKRTQKLSSEERIGSWVMEHLPETKYFAKLFTVDTQNLNILAISEISYWYQRFNWALIGALIPVGMVMLSAMSGQSISLPLMMIFIGALCGWMLYNSSIDSHAKNAREEFSRAIATYLEGVAMRRAQGANTSTAAASAAEVSNTWVFTRIKNRMTIAHHQGKQPWDALYDLGKELQVKELSELASILKQAGENDTQIYEALRNHAELINGRILNDQHEKANAATERLSLFFPLVALVAIVMLLFPIIMSLTTPL
ncbi:hypothetical protein HMPREF2942_00115 [Rothia sp. HMSC071C12]|uniref:hypothetical protein n=1 Tax=Rothia sp. HMSC071C12 TaxID=1739446 RepID=UPI0008A12751|nr:hypothetical protein [Rothia sp. HMSC071C12]OFQ37942.1 hypothetical protein HMPREF2942_00115 [Rothia sp. HMSC071C12]